MTDSNGSPAPPPGEDSVQTMHKPHQDVMNDLAGSSTPQ